MLDPQGWLKNLPTSFQFSLAMALVGVGFAVWAGFDKGLHDETGTVLTFLGSLAGATIAHDGFSRSKMAKDDASSDMKGG